MTYFGFIVRFLLVPLVLLGALTLWDLRRGKRLIWRLNDGLEWAALAVLGAVALLYTTPWDNYEATFFLLTNMLIVFGIVLLLVYESRRHKAVSLGPVFARSNQI